MGDRVQDFALNFSNEGTCPRCNEWKFIGHGPLCIDCYLNNVDTYEGTEHPKAVWPPEEERR